MDGIKTQLVSSPRIYSCCSSRLSGYGMTRCSTGPSLLRRMERQLILQLNSFFLGCITLPELSFFFPRSIPEVNSALRLDDTCFTRAGIWAKALRQSSQNSVEVKNVNQKK